MSEIREYRGKRVDTGEWVYGLPYNGYAFLSGEYIGIQTTIESVSGKKNIFAQYGVDPKTVGQWTGLFAVDNKTKLFEDDIVCHSFKNSTAIIRFGAYCDNADGQEKDHYGFYLEYLDKDSRYYKGINKWAGYPSMVHRLGNIHDNPELKGGE